MGERVTTPFNQLYLPGAEGRYTKYTIATVTPGTATQITTFNKHGLYKTDIINIYNNGTQPYFNYIDFNPTVIDGNNFTIPVDTTSYTVLCSDGYVVKRSSIVGPPRREQDYNDVALSVTPTTDRYITIEKQKNTLDLQSEVDLSLLGIPREEQQSTQIEEVTKYGIDNRIWKFRSGTTYGNDNWWFGSGYQLIDTNVPLFRQNYKGVGVEFIPNTSSIMLYANMAPYTAPIDNTLNSLYPGNWSNGEAFATLESIRPFKYLPGRVNSFTFGVRAVVDNLSSIPDSVYQDSYQAAGAGAYPYRPSGNIARWGVGNSTDTYYFEISGNAQTGSKSEVVFSVNRRKYYKGDRYTSSEPWYTGDGRNPFGNFSLTREYPDDPFFCVNLDKTFIDPTNEVQELTRVLQKDFSQDKVDGTGKSGAKIDLTKVTMLKIDFSWYGAIGARFYAYLPTKHNNAEWILLHELVSSNTFSTPALQNPVMYIKYMTKARAGANVRLYKYGVSAYIEGGEAGTKQQRTIYNPEPKIINNTPRPILGISTVPVIPSAQGENIPNQKVIYPTKFNISTTADCIVEMVWKPTKALIHGITKGHILTGVSTEVPDITATILPNTDFKAISGEFANYVVGGNSSNVVDYIGARIYESINNNIPQTNPYRTNSAIFNTYVSAVSTHRVTNDVLWLTQPLTGFPVSLTNYLKPNSYTNYVGIPLPFRFEQLDRQAISNETFSGNLQYTVAAARLDNATGYASIPSLSASPAFTLGQYFLRNYITELSGVAFTATLTSVAVTTRQPHLLTPGDTATYFINSKNDVTRFKPGLVDVARTSCFLSATRIVSPNTFVAAVTGVTSFNNTPQTPLTFKVIDQFLPITETPYIVLNRIPDYIPQTNISYSGITDVRGFTAPAYQGGSFGVTNLNYTQRPGNFVAGVTPLTAIAAQFFTYGSRYVDFGTPANTDSTPITFNVNNLPVNSERTAQDPFRLLFSATNYSDGSNGIKDVIVANDFFNLRKQVTYPVNWTPLSSIRISTPSTLRKAGLSAFYAPGSIPGDLPPNFAEAFPGCGAAIDIQSSQPIYYKNWLSDYWAQFSSPRNVVSFRLGANQDYILDISQYFGQVKEFLSNYGTTADLNAIAWNSIYFVGRTIRPNDTGTVTAGISWDEQ